MDTRGEGSGHAAIPCEVGLIQRDYFYLSDVRVATGRYRVFVTYKQGGEERETVTHKGFDDLQLAIAERDRVMMESIEEIDHGVIPLEDILWVEVRERVIREPEVDNERPRT